MPWQQKFKILVSERKDINKDADNLNRTPKTLTGRTDLQQDGEKTYLFAKKPYRTAKSSAGR
jgi:hypothetical protein